MIRLLLILASLAALTAAPARAQGLVVRSVLPISGPMKLGSWHWNEARAPKAGRIVVTVDTHAQVLSIFRDGHEIGAATILYGSDEKPTPRGVYPVRWKKAVHASRTYGGAPMPFTLNLTPDGVAIHGSDVRVGYATHGCIGVPTAFARKLFASVPVGTPVIVTNGKMIGVGDAITR